MDDNAKNTSSYQLDQEILDARGINMTVEEVAGLSTCKYSERVQSLKLNDEDLAFLKGLRRRIKNRMANAYEVFEFFEADNAAYNTERKRRRAELREECDPFNVDNAESVKRYRLTKELTHNLCDELRPLMTNPRRSTDLPVETKLASQNSRRRSVEHLRRLARELRAVRACRDDALAERRALVTQRDCVRDQCNRLRRYIIQILQDRSDLSEIPSIDVETTRIESQKSTPKIVTVTETITPLLPECFENKTSDNSNNSYENSDKSYDNSAENFENSAKHFDNSAKHFENSAKDFENSAKNIFECRIDKLVQQSVNHIFKNDDKKKVFAKTVFISNEKLSSEIKSMVLCDSDMKLLESDNGVLNLSLKEGRRKTHGRKQLAPRRIAYVYTDSNDGVLDLKVKKEPQ